MKLIRFNINKFNQSFLGLLFTSFYGYLPHISFLFVFIKYYNKLKFKKYLFYYTFFLLFLLLVSFLFTFNLNILRVLGLIFVSFVLFSLTQILFAKYEKIFFNLPEKLFFIHGFVTVLTIFSPDLNSILSGVKGTTGRISGLVGFDYMAFFYSTYLITDYFCSNRKISFIFILKLLISTLFVILSGRFGITIVSYIILYIYFDNISIKKTFLFFLIIIISIFLLKDQLEFIYGTFKGFWAYLLDNSNTDLKDFSEQNSNDDGYYSASPLTWLFMFLKPFLNISHYILPSIDSVTVDPGPSNMILNLGLILTLLVYHYFTFFFKSNKSIIWPLLFIYLLSDIKFHGIFVPSCMFWLFLNINKLNVYDSVKKLSVKR